MGQRNAKILPRKTRISETPCFFATLGQRNAKKDRPRRTRISAMPKFFTTLGQRIAKSNREIHEFHTKLHSLTPVKMPRKVFIFPEFRTSFEMHSLTPSTLTKQTTWEHLVACFLNCRPIVTHSDSSTLVQDAVLNCYKKPAHYYYQFSDFFRRPTSSCVVF